MNWMYLAGFFDGEGSVDFHSARGVYWTVAQSGNRGHALLSEIQQFFAANSIKSELYGPYGASEMWTLYVTERDEIIRLGKFLLGKIKIKKHELQDLIRYIELYPAIQGRVRRRINNLRREMGYHGSLRRRS